MNDRIWTGTDSDILRLIRLPDLITILNALFGFTAILYVLNDDPGGAAMLVLAAAIADAVDGAVARRVESGVFGENLDSFADMISFGIAPAFTCYAIVGVEHHAIACAFSAAYLVCGALRLARFGITDLPEFCGLPITAAGTFAVLLVYLIDSQYLVIVTTGVFILLSVLMVSDIRYPKVRSLTIQILLAAVFILTIAAHCTGFHNCFAWILFTLIGIYIISPLAGYSLSLG